MKINLLKKVMKKAAATLIAVFLCSTGNAVTLLSYDIPTSTTTITSVNPYSFATGVVGGTIDKGSGLTLSSSTSGWRATSYNQTTNTVAAIDAANTGGDYWSFSMGASSGYDVVVNGIGSLSFGTSASGPKSWALLYSTTSSFTSYNTIASYTGAAGATVSVATDWTTALGAAPITINAGNTGYFRIIGYNATSTSGTGGIIGNLTAPDFTILGNVNALNVIRNLIWNGGNGNWSNGGAGWNEAGTNYNFNNNDNVTISSSGEITVDAGGVSTGTWLVDASSGNINIVGGTVTAGSLTKSGNSRLILNNANTITGGTILNGGEIEVNANGVFGGTGLTLNGGALIFTNSNATAVNNSTQIGSAGVNITNNVNITFGGAITGSNNIINKYGSGQLSITNNLGSNKQGLDINVLEGSLLVQGGAKNFGGAMVWNGNVYFVNSTNYFDNNVVISGTGTVYQSNSVLASVFNTLGNSPVISNNIIGQGNFGFTSASSRNFTVDGVLTADSATLLTITGANKVKLENEGNQISSTINIASGGGLNAAVTGLLGANNITNNATLSLTGTQDATLARAIVGTGSVTNNSTGKITWTATNSYTGPTTLNAGTLYVDGSLTSATTVNSGAILSGNGSLTSVTLNGGTISPGHSPGLLSIATLDASNGTLYFELGDSSIRGSTYDAIDITGALTIGPNTIFTFVPWNGYQFQLNDSYDLLNWGSLVDNGYDNNSLLTSLPSLNDNSLQWDVTTFKTDGIVSVIPEPSPLGLLILGGSMLYSLRRLRRNG